MCQLTYIQLNNKQVKRTVLSTLLRVNAKAGHNDGYGFFDGTNLFKSEKSASTLSINLLPNSNNDDPIMAHVRKASATFINKQGEEFSHPFLENNNINTGSLICAHNGTLSNDNIPKDMIDSQFFTQELYKNLSTKEFGPAFRETITEFYGKFAFLFNYNKVNYIARGRTATLFNSDITINGSPAGFCINTELESLTFSLYLLNDFLYNYGIEFNFTTPTILEMNTLYKVKDNHGLTFESSIEKLTSITFFEREKCTAWKNEGRNVTVYNRTKNNVGEDFGNFSHIAKFMEMYDFTLLELDHIMFIQYGYGLLNATGADIGCLVDSLKLLSKTASKNRTKAFTKALSTYPILSRKLIYSHGLVPFPYFLLPPNYIIQAIKKTHEEVTNNKL